MKALASCRYSIHDLSRSRGEGDANLARFNMPLELGMAMALRGWRPDEDAHEYLMLVPAEGLLYQRFISDLAGFDPQHHDGTPARIVAEVLAWLLASPSAPAQVRPTEVIAKLPRFSDALSALRDEWQGGTQPWGDVVRTAIAIARGPAP